MTLSSTKPFLKWAGGKRWLAELHPWLFDGQFDRLVEPFVGSAAVFFHLQPKRAWLNDVNRELVDAYIQVKENAHALYGLLKEYHGSHSERFYYEVRESRPLDLLHRAARFIYLNRTCFNGIYRVNLQGEFNVPKGTKAKVLLPDDDFEAIALLLKSVKLTALDFEQVIDECGKGDLVFLDPPYTVRHNLNGFLKYNERLFSWSDQVRLSDAAYRAKRRGARVIVSNADHRSIRELYVRGGEIFRLKRHSIVAADARKRKATTELIIKL